MQVTTETMGDIDRIAEATTITIAAEVAGINKQDINRTKTADITVVAAVVVAAVVVAAAVVVIPGDNPTIIEAGDAETSPSKKNNCKFIVFILSFQILFYFPYHWNQN